jgi:hypothetical protein
MSKDEPRCPVITTTASVPMENNQSSLTACACGPDLVAGNPPGSRRRHTGR